MTLTFNRRGLATIFAVCWAERQGAEYTASNGNWVSCCCISAAWREPSSHRGISSVPLIRPCWSKSVHPGRTSTMRNIQVLTYLHVGLSQFCEAAYRRAIIGLLENRGTNHKKLRARGGTARNRLCIDP